MLILYLVNPAYAYLIISKEYQVMDFSVVTHKLLSLLDFPRNF